MHPLRSAQDLYNTPAARTFLASPPSFDGTIDELFERFIAPNLPDAADVADFHRAIRAYVKRPDPLFLVRQTAGLQRRSSYATRDGLRFKATDSAPAWWMHSALFQGARVASDAIADVVSTMPAHQYDGPPPLARAAAQRGWHLAHILPVTGGPVDHRAYAKRELVSRFVRNVHPCNYFLVPKANGLRWSADPRVTGYFAAVYARRYADVWPEFLALAGMEADEIPMAVDPVRYTYGITSPADWPNVNGSEFAGARSRG